MRGLLIRAALGGLFNVARVQEIQSRGSAESEDVLSQQHSLRGCVLASHLRSQVLKRTAKLFIIGILTQGSDFPSIGNHGINLKTVRIPGILQRIAWAYMVVALIALYVPQVLLLLPLLHPEKKIAR